jgi:tetratricopeptide (TPR) repeat protein
VPTLATILHERGFRTAAFIAAFPLDHQFGLDRGFDVYSDRLPRDASGRQSDERPASSVVSEAIAWLGTNDQRPTANNQFLLWVHLFEPHAPYAGDPARPVIDRYDDEIATCDREIGRLLEGLGARRSDTAVIVAGDHGEAFGEHGEYAHSIFVYDTTLRVPLIVHVPGLSTPRIVSDPVTLADLAPTVAKLLGGDMPDVDGIDLSPALRGTKLADREIYAESFAPLLEFGWAPLRAIRSDRWKYIAAPKPELYDVEHDAGEQTNEIAAQDAVARRLDDRVNRYSPPTLAAAPTIDASSLERLRALGYAMASRPTPAGSGRIDPKDRRDVAASIALVTSGELSGDRLESALENILRVDPANGQAHMRLGFARLAKNDCAHAEREFTAAIDGGLPSVDAHIGLATCLGRRNDLAGAARVLDAAKRREPANPVVTANLGILEGARGNNEAAIRSLQSALTADPNLHEARFNLALAYARLGRKTEAREAAEELLRRLPPNAPQRPEVQRLIASIQ